LLQIFVHNCTAERAYGPFMGRPPIAAWPNYISVSSKSPSHRAYIGISPPFITFRDAGFCINTFPLTVLDCARAMRRACSLGHFNYRAFNPTAFHNLAKLQNGDLSWIVPGKFLAFSGPIAKLVPVVLLHPTHCMVAPTLMLCAIFIDAI
jgi:hypothetical protein